MPLQLPVQFGKYVLSELIARGGMAEVYRAKASGEIGGFERIYAIKRILPELGQNSDFIHSLINEAKITVTLSHSNIAQVYDLGKVEDNYYLAMEYVHGPDLHTLVQKVFERGELMPFEHAIHVAMSMLAGLDVAHRKRDDTGKPLNIVHRDISPHNVLVSYAGDVKIIDFGIARAANKLGQTRRGVIKGKLLYMAPEQARADPIDHRIDLFAVGMTLYWMLTGVLPFDAQNQYDIYRKAVECRIPDPRRFVQHLPDDLGEVLRIAMQREASLRFQDAYEFRSRLERVLLRLAPGFGQDTFRAFVESVTGPAPVTKHSAAPAAPMPVAAPTPADGPPVWARGLEMPSEVLVVAEPEPPLLSVEELAFEEKPTMMQIDAPSVEALALAKRTKTQQRRIPPVVAHVAPAQRPATDAPRLTSPSLAVRLLSESSAVVLDWLVPVIFGLLGAFVLALLTYVIVVV